MFENINISIIGIVYLLMLFIPNILWSKHLPHGYDSSDENKVLLMLERVGQVFVSVFAVVSFQPVSFQIDVCLILSCIAMLFYEGYWINYFKSSQELSDFYASFLKIPLAGATLPIFAFLCLGIYEHHVFLIFSTILLGIGHIGLHYEHFQKLKA